MFAKDDPRRTGWTAFRTELTRRIQKGALSCFVLGFFFLPGAESVPPKMIKVKVFEQKLYLLENGKIVKSYPVSTSKYGIGNREGSNQTPLGRHKIVNKIGGNAAWGTIFKERKNTGKTIRDKGAVGPEDKDLVTTRIMRLEGLEKGVNKGSGIDSFERCIYIHGTPEEDLIGTPASHGCIRMKNSDVIELFDNVELGTPVTIEK